VKTLGIVNPFGAPVYYRKIVSSTMDEARLLAAAGESHGTVIAADFQEAGRGRTRGRIWAAEPGKNLLFTIILRYPDLQSIPRAITLRAGLALSLAVEDFAPALAGLVTVKWPNDLMLDHGTGAARKAAGILTEAEDGAVFIGIGVNVAQTEFSGNLRSGAASIRLALAGTGAPPREEEAAGSPEARFRLLERILSRLRRELEPGGGDGDWRRRLEDRLYLLGRELRFAPGSADSGELIEGRLAGIGPEGELRIIPRGEAKARSFVTGELRFP
jgi:BirA family biotin operon repressor/biotin-[acetyl-CoA-carboxylase] ligase